MEDIKEKIADIPAFGPELPSLSPELSEIYQNMNDFNRRSFIKMFRYLWGVVAPASRFTGFGGLLYSYYAVDLLRLRLDLSPSELSMLSFLYKVTDKGRQIIHSSKVYAADLLPNLTLPGKKWLLLDLKYKGYITRTTRDPRPHYKKYHAPVFMSLSPAGVRLIEDFETDLYKILVNNCLNDLKGTTKKPRLSRRGKIS